MIHILTVTNASGQTELISKFENFEMHEELNENFTLSFTSFPHINNPGHDLIDQETIIEYEGYEFRVKQLRKSTYSKQVTAISTYFDMGDERKYDTYGGTHTLDEFMSYVLSGTGWTFVNEDVDQSVLILDFGNDSVKKLIDTLKSAFKCEMKIEPNKVLRFAKKLGPDNDEQYRYGHNIISVHELTDTSNLKTYIEGHGKDGLVVKYTSPAAEAPGIGIRHADPFEDDSIDDPDVMLERLKDELQDSPESTVELDATELQEKEIGERVWLIHEKIGIEYQTRVISKRTRIPKSLSTVTLGNIKPKTLSGMLASQKVEIDNNNKKTKSRFHQTDERITMEVERIDESISQIELTADSIRLSVEDLDDDLRSELSITATQIRSEVTGHVTRLDGLIENANSSITQTANSIRSEVASEITALDGRITTANSSITQLSNRVTTEVYQLDSTMGSLSAQLDVQAGAIISKVEKADYNGTALVSMINQSAGSVSINANAINLNGVTNLNGLAQVSDTLRIGESGGFNQKSLIFNSAARIIGGTGPYNVGLTLYGDPVAISGQLDLSAATVKGLSLTAKFG